MPRGSARAFELLQEQIQLFFVYRLEEKTKGDKMKKKILLIGFDFDVDGICMQFRLKGHTQ
jgi:hypothetical protein